MLFLKLVLGKTIAAVAGFLVSGKKMKPTGAKLRNWRVAVMRARAHGLGTVAAPDQKSAEDKAVKAFGLSEDELCAKVGDGVRR